ncbi:MAG: ATP-dependent helicase, partial [Leptolyngbyaceae bacterium]|nr:ATP-dependent helicase [Leptolyngbyaceae bacterium]
MHILHGTWIPNSVDDFVIDGMFYLWVETSEKRRFRSPRHPRQLVGDELAALLSGDLSIQPPDYRKIEDLIVPRYFILPTVDNEPLPSVELSRYLEADLPETFEFQPWQVECYPTLTSAKINTYSTRQANGVVPMLNDLHFIALHNLTDVQLGADLLFWFHFTQAIKRLILKDQYIPALKYHELEPAKPTKSTRKKADASTSGAFRVHPSWEFIGEEYETTLQHYVDFMPLMCVAGFAESPGTVDLYDRLSLLRHFSDCLLVDVVTHTYLTKAIEKSIDDSILRGCLHPVPWPQSVGLETYQQWQAWRDRIIRTQTDQSFHLYFHLYDPHKPEDAWQLQFEVAPKHDPSLRVSLDDYWRMRPNQQKQVKQQMGENFEQNLLMNLGYAARMYPSLWRGLETDQPQGISLSLDAAFTFLKESAWVLENA